MKRFVFLFTAASLVVVFGIAIAAQTELARRGEAVVTVSDFETRLKQIPTRDRKVFLRNSKRVNDVLSIMLIREQLALDAIADGFDQTEEAQEVMRLAARHALAEFWVEHYVQNAPEADYELLARERYASNPDRYRLPEMVDVTHLLVSTETRSAEEAKSLAEGYLSEIQQDPGRFDALVKAHSEDPSVAQNDGRFVRIRRGEFAPRFEQVAFGMTEPGSIGGPVQTQFGYHIIRLDGYHPPQSQSFEDVRPQLEQAVRNEHRDRIRAEYLSSIGRAPAEISNEGLIEVLREYYSEEELRQISESAARADLSGRD